MRRKIVSLTLLFFGLTFFQAPAQTVYMKDTPADTGAEPNPDTGPMWVSQDIWVQNAPDPNYSPYPFTASSPPWVFPAHQNPVYRDPLKSTPNYVYVEVRNDSSVASTGTERLRVYWAKASTGLSWPTQWVDYQPGGPLTLLYGAEITKPRKNAATASTAERDAYVHAVLHIGTDPAFAFPMGLDYWHTQQDIHSNMGSQSNIHETLAFEPWHREFINRYELLLQQYDPTVKLLYWDWTTSPSPSLSFMGSFSGSIGAPFNPSSGATLAPPSVSRGLGSFTHAELDSAILARDPYGPFTSYCGFGCPPAPPSSAPFMSALEDYSHNYSHGFIGGNMNFPSSSAEDPFFFMLHGNVDRLWAQWQRDPAHLPRLDPAQTYGASLASDANLQLTMSPWDGSPGGATSASSFPIQPWETTTPAPSGGTYVVAKTPDDPSVVSPPIYDVAPLTIPKLQPGQAVVLQIPWYPPDPSNFSSFGADAGHFCLVARIETSALQPYGMDFPETSDIYANTKNNNKIVWKNVEIVDDLPGPMMMKSFLVRNVFDKPTQMSLHFAEARSANGPLLRQARIFVDLKPQLFARWRRTTDRTIRPAGEAASSRIEILSPDATIRNITLAAHETFSVNVEFELSKAYSARAGAPLQFDLIQLGAPGNPNQIVGGQRYTVDLSRLVPVKSGAEWRYWDNGSAPEGAWTSSDYNDADWKHGTAPFGSAAELATRIGAAAPGRRFTAAYFRHSFDVADPSFFRTALLRLKYADAAAVFLNGKEIYRGGLPAGEVNADTMATRKLAGLERRVFVPVKIDPALLRRGKNVFAAEIHANAPEYTDIGFDLELLANYVGAGFPPDIGFAAPRDAVYQAGETVPVQIEAYSGDAKIESVSLYADGHLVGTRDRAPYTFNWMAGSIGAHRLRAIAIDDRKLESSSFRTLTAADHLLPSVELVGPRSMAAVKEGEAISVGARASEHDGKIARVEFWVKDMATWTSPSIRVASVTSPPYTASIRGLKPGHYMLWAIAVNDHGGTTQSYPGHIMVTGPK